MCCFYVLCTLMYMSCIFILCIALYDCMLVGSKALKSLCCYFDITCHKFVIASIFRTSISFIWKPCERKNSPYLQSKLSFASRYSQAASQTETNDRVVHFAEQKNKNIQKRDRPKMPIMQKGSRKRRTLHTQMWKIELHQKSDYWRNIYATQYVQYWIPRTFKPGENTTYIGHNNNSKKMEITPNQCSNCWKPYSTPVKSNTFSSLQNSVH